MVSPSRVSSPLSHKPISKYYGFMFWSALSVRPLSPQAASHQQPAFLPVTSSQADASSLDSRQSCCGLPGALPSCSRALALGELQGPAWSVHSAREAQVLRDLLPFLQSSLLLFFPSCSSHLELLKGPCLSSSP